MRLNLELSSFKLLLNWYSVAECRSCFTTAVFDFRSSKLDIESITQYTGSCATFLLGGPMNPMLPQLDDLKESIACLVKPTHLRLYSFDPFQDERTIILSQEI